MVKLIVTDIDGTLVRDGCNDLNPKIFDLIRELRKKDIIFVVCSGRSYTSMVKLFEQVKDEVIFICENGGLIKCRERTISECHIKREYIEDLVKESRNIEEIIPCLCTTDVMYIERADEKSIRWILDGYKVNSEVVDDLLNCSCNLDKVIKFATLDKLGVQENSLKKYSSKWWDILSVTESGIEWLDMMPKGISKGNGVADLQHYLDISKDNTMVFGDNLNDISMLKEATYSFAVANAREEVKNVAKYIADSNVNDGVIKILEKVVKGDCDFGKYYS